MKKLLKKILAPVAIFSLLTPNFALATENLFYYFDNVYGYSDFKSNYKQIDILSPQIYEVDYDLTVSRPKSTKLISRAKKNKVDVMPLLVNNDFSKVLMSDILINPAAQDKIIDFMIKEADKRDYIGWQFDFENINHLDRDLYTAFVKKTYERLKAEGLQFSVAVIVRSNEYNRNDKNQDWSGAYDYDALAANSDFLSLMTYDDPNSVGPVSSLQYVERILQYMLTQASPEKLSLGIPLYCWHWQDGKRINSTTYKLAEKAYKKEDGIARGFNESYGAEFFSYRTGDITHITWCDNARSFEMKQEIIDRYGLRGFSAWALGQGDKDIWKFLKKNP